MAEKPAAERTEQPTPRRLGKAREKGQVPQSQDLGSAVTLVALFVSVALLAPGLLRWFKGQIETSVSGQTAPLADATTFAAYLNANILEAVVIMLPILTAISVAGIAASIAIGGVTFSAGAIGFKWEAINPVSALQRFGNVRSLVHLISSIAKLFAVGLIVWLYLRDKLETMAALRWAWSSQLIGAIASMTFGLGIRVGIAILVLGLADAIYQKWQYIQELKMTRQEVKQERKDSEGSPEVKGRIRRIQIQMSMKRLTREVPKASVILVNPTHVAVALQYEAKTMDAPVLLAKGADHMAQKIITIGRSYGVPIVRRPEVARAIYASVQPGQRIPESLYMAVAEVLAMIYRLRQNRRARR
ncbi:MAG TPA: flagellar biosynthesis protein FlhB [Sedimentisphaerales bacterium]|nr:flagellar biosynthesis protein FlhB [Sedimentisphaerales bacterium]HRS10886.1 flagellar biosynthesis protein FlhB [Sedimentisphaerales bacterium]HRV47591.1 flagellar biosynthesis protein FlhB [Sedimentisphaerales bacterium]